MASNTREFIKACLCSPYQAFLGLAFLVLLPIMALRLVNIATTDYVQTSGKLVDNSPINERIREGKKEYFFKANYTFQVGEQAYSFTSESSDSNEQKLYKLKSEMDSVPVWYNEDNPEEFTTDSVQLYWQPYALIILIGIGVLAYVRWHIVKYYELEFKDSRA